MQEQCDADSHIASIVRKPEEVDAGNPLAFFVLPPTLIQGWLQAFI